MGVVYEAEDLSLRRHVALKLLPDGMAESRQALERFKREARAASSLNHPNICVIHDIGEDNGRSFIVMEFLEGQTLKHRIGERPMALDAILSFGVQIADALEAAHIKGIIHRDIKPANIFVTVQDQVKLLDFGLATQTSRGAKDALPTASVVEALTRPGALIGTVAYMSPEQAQGDKLDERTDLFSFGAVLYEMATGGLPFSGQSTREILEGILTREPVPLVRLNPDVPPKFQEIVGKAMEKDRSLRYQGAAEVRADLQRLSRDTIKAAVPAGKQEQVARSGWPSRRASWIAAGVIGLVMAISGGISLGKRSDNATAVSVPTGRPSIAVLPFVDMSPDKDQEYFTDGLSEELLNVLAKNPALHVAARTSSFQFKSRNADIATIGQRLNVATILDGSVRKAGKRVRVTAQLVKVEDGFTLWSETYDRELDDILAVQEGIARAVSAALNTTLLDTQAPPKGRINAEAYSLYLQGKYFAARRSREDLERAAGYFDKALQLDAGYAPAWVGLAETHATQARLGYISPSGGVQMARNEVQRALAVDPNLADPYAVLGTIRRSFDWDWSGANAACKRALELEPGNARAIACAARVASTLGRFDEAIDLYRRAISIDPLSAAVYIALGGVSLAAGSQGEAEQAFRKALELEPEYPGGRFSLGVLYLVRSQPEVALHEMEREGESIWRRQGLALAYYALGRKQDADAALARLIDLDTQRYALQIATVYAFRGEPDKAFEYIELAYAQRDPGLPGMKGHPLWKNLESDVRYKALLTKMGLPI